MDFNYTKIKFGNWLFKNCFPLYNYSYKRFKLKNDKTEIDVLKSLIKPGDHILDIGANIGFYAALLSEMTGPGGTVYCFEPDGLNFSHLQKNAAKLSNVKLFNKAVAAEKGILKVYKSKLLNVDHRTYPVNNYDSIEEIEAVSIDDMIAQGLIKQVNIIKIDIQGFELSAFTGMRQLLSAQSDLKIVAEYWPHGFKRAGVSALQFYDFFHELGYTFTILEDQGTKTLSRAYVAEYNEAPFEFSFNVLIQRP